MLSAIQPTAAPIPNFTKKWNIGSVDSLCMTAANSRSLQFPVSMEFRHAKSTSTHDVTAFVFAFGEVLLCSIMTKCAMRTTVRGTVLKARPITSSKPFGEVIYYPCLKIVHCAGDLDNPIRLHFGRTGLSLRMSAIVISTFFRATASTNAWVFDVLSPAQVVAATAGGKLRAQLWHRYGRVRGIGR
jgi:hypothetical protein